jgi:hypothetical protein
MQHTLGKDKLTIGDEIVDTERGGELVSIII